MAAMTDTFPLKAGSMSGGSRRSSHNKMSDYEEQSAFPFPLVNHPEETSGHDSGSDIDMDLPEDRRTLKHRNSRHSRPRTRHTSSPSRKPSFATNSIQMQDALPTTLRKTSSTVERDPSLPLPVETLSILLHRDSFDEDFGLEITGGTDTGRMLIISDVYPRGVAQLAGLCAQDVLLEIDGINAMELSHHDAVQIFKSALQVWLKVERAPQPSDLSQELNRPSTSPRSSTNSNSLLPTGKRLSKVALRADADPDVHSSPRCKDSKHLESVNNGQLNNQAYAWIDLQRQPCSPPPDEDALSIYSPNFLPERKTTLLVSEDIHLGLLIRGGLEYGLGIYVTGLDKASAAEAANLKVGDQILSVNNYDFRRITHSRAVRVLRTHRHMNMKVRHVGKLPFARRLSPSSTTPQLPAFLPANQSPVLYKNTSPLITLDAEQDEINRLMREASRDILVDEPSPFLSSSSEGLLEDTIDLETAVNNWSKSALAIERSKTRAKVKTTDRNEYWLAVIESSAEVLLEDISQKEALMYFIDDYLKGSICVDALVLSFFHWIDSVPKFQLIEDIRNVIHAQDIHLYDSLTSGMKTEWMTFPSKLFAGISGSNTNLALLTSMSPTRSPLPDYSSLVLPLNTSSPVLKSALKSTSSVTLPTDFSMINVPAYTAFSDPMKYPSLQAVSESPVIMTPAQVMSWSMPDSAKTGAIAAPLTWVQPNPVTKNNGALKFEYDAPLLDMELFTPQMQLPVQPAQAPPQMPPQPTQVFQPAQHINPYQAYENDQNPYLQPTTKSFSPDSGALSLVQNGTMGLWPPSGQRLRGQLGGPRRSVPSAFEGSSFSPRWPGRLDRKAIVQHHAYPDEERIHYASSRSSPDIDSRSFRGSNVKLSSSPRPRLDTGNSQSTHSGDDYSDREQYKDRRKYSYEDDAVSVNEPVTKNRPQSLMMNHKIGPSKSDLKLPVVIETFKVKKNAPYLGIAIEGGTETKQTLPRIINIQPNGCAHLNGNLKVGHVIISVNGKKLENLSHANCVKVIKDEFLDKSSNTMEFVVKEVNKLPST